MGNRVSTQTSLELRLTVASTVAIGAAAWGVFNKLEKDRLAQQLADATAAKRTASEAAPAGPPAGFQYRGQKIVLTYFDITGKGEPIRYALTCAGIPFEDRRVTGEEFRALKPTLQFGQLPHLTVGGNDDEDRFELVQSAAIMRFVGKCARDNGVDSLYPVDPALSARVDAIVDQEADAFTGLRVARYKGRFGFYEEFVPAEVFARAAAVQNEDIIPRHLTKLDTLLKGSATGWLAGTAGPSIADLVWVAAFRSLQAGWSNDNTEVLCAFPRLEDLCDRLEQLPWCVEYQCRRMNEMNTSA